MQLFKSLLDCDTTVNLLLLDSCEIRAERSKHRVKCWLNVGLEDSFHRLGFNINDNYRELNDFICLQGFRSISILALTFKVIHANIVERSRVEKLLILKVHDGAEIFWGYAAIC